MEQLWRMWSIRIIVVLCGRCLLAITAKFSVCNNMRVYTTFVGHPHYCCTYFLLILRGIIRTASTRVFATFLLMLRCCPSLILFGCHSLIINFIMRTCHQHDDAEALPLRVQASSCSRTGTQCGQKCSANIFNMHTFSTRNI